MRGGCEKGWCSGMKVVITARNFTNDTDNRAIEVLKAKGYEVIDCSDCNQGTASADAVAALIQDADAAITAMEEIDGTVLQKCPNLKVISRRGIGYDTIDLEACRAHGIAVARTTGTVEAAVAEHVMAYILYFAREVAEQNGKMHEGIWKREMRYGAKNRTLGLVGFGGIGKEIAKRASAFGMDILYYCRHPKKEWEETYDARFCEWEELLAISDYISVNVPLTAETRGMFGAEEFKKMKPECVFINIARDQVVDVKALCEMLDRGGLRGACVDVFAKEPCTDSPLRACRRAVLTPHTASFTSENFGEMNLCAAQNVIDYLEGHLADKYRVI